MRRHEHLLATYLPGLAVIAVLIATPRLTTFTIANLALQAVLFTALAAIPAWRTARMSYVDIAWPWGLVLIGVQIPIWSPHFGLAALAMCVAYLAIGLRMGLPGAVYLVRFRRLRGEFARYRYQRIRWAAAGWRSERAPMQLEIFVQGLANASVLVIPALLLACGDQRLGPSQWAGFAAWAGAWCLEGLADRQKRRFAAGAGRGATCTVGLWRYSRHPNYFFQWVGWVALALAAAPAASSAALGVALAGAPAFMLWTLVHLTGIKPAEHYSAQKRQGYAEYQRSTNSFIPGPRRAAGQA
jgi:steroid 5-alpha reductase family enzyme